MEIIALSQQNLSDINKANQPFEVIGKIKPIFVDGTWTYTEEIYEHPYTKAYADDAWDAWDYAAGMDNPDKAFFLAYADAECVGQIVLKRDWNRYAFIEDISVAASARGQGIGTALIQKAVSWAKNAGLF